MPVQMVRNNQPGPTVISSDPKGTESVEWQGLNDANGGDIQPVSELIVNLAQFQKCVRRGIFTILDNESASEAIAKAEALQQQEWDRRQRATSDVAAEVIDVAANADFIALPCVGPSPKAGIRCGEPVPVRDVSKNDHAPLCSMHEALAAQYTPSEEVKDGRNTTVWTRVIMAPRERQQ